MAHRATKSKPGKSKSGRPPRRLDWALRAVLWCTIDGLSTAEAGFRLQSLRKGASLQKILGQKPYLDAENRIALQRLARYYLTAAEEQIDREYSAQVLSLAAAGDRERAELLIDLYHASAAGSTTQAAKTFKESLRSRDAWEAPEIAVTRSLTNFGRSR